MKKKVLLSAILIAAVMLPVFGWEQMKRWNWTQNRISFQTPVSMKITKNTGTEFVGAWKAMGFSIKPFQDKNLNASQVAFQGYLRNTATLDKNVTRKTNVSLGQGLKGYAIFGKGMQKGRVVKFVYLGLIDPNSPHNYAVNWVWYSSPQADALYDNVSYEMAKSFKKI